MKRHILQVSSSLSWGGMEMASVRLALKLSEKGHRVSFLCDPDSKTAQALCKSNVAVVPIGLKGYLDPWNGLKISRWAAQECVDLVHCHYARDLWVLAPALSGRFRSVPLVLTKHIGTRKPKKDILHRVIYRRVDGVIAISEVIKKNILRTHPIGPDRVCTIPNGVELVHFNPKRPRRILIRRVFSIPDEAMVIGMAGRLNWWKGYKEFLQMAEHLLRHRNDVWFLAVGGPTLGEEQEAEAIHRLARSLDLKDRVIFTGFRDDMADLYSAMDLFVYPAYAEAFGLVLIEAMAAGLPVVSTNCDGVPEIVLDGVTGTLVAARNADRLIEAVKELMASPSKIHSFSQAGRERAEAVYDLNNMVAQTDRLYEKFITERKI